MYGPLGREVLPAEAAAVFHAVAEHTGALAQVVEAAAIERRDVHEPPLVEAVRVIDADVDFLVEAHHHDGVALGGRLAPGDELFLKSGLAPVVAPNGELGVHAGLLEDGRLAPREILGRAAELVGLVLGDLHLAAEHGDIGLPQVGRGLHAREGRPQLHEGGAAHALEHLLHVPEPMRGRDPLEHGEDGRLLGEVVHELGALLRLVERDFLECLRNHVRHCLSSLGVCACQALLEHVLVGLFRAFRFDSARANG